jgi:hypothetical protein
LFANSGGVPMLHSFSHPCAWGVLRYAPLVVTGAARANGYRAV